MKDDANVTNMNGINIQMSLTVVYRSFWWELILEKIATHTVTRRGVLWERRKETRLGPLVELLNVQIQHHSSRFWKYFGLKPIQLKWLLHIRWRTKIPSMQFGIVTGTSDLTYDLFIVTFQSYSVTLIRDLH